MTSPSVSLSRLRQSLLLPVALACAVFSLHAQSPASDAAAVKPVVKPLTAEEIKALDGKAAASIPATSPAIPWCLRPSK